MCVTIWWLQVIRSQDQNRAVANFGLQPSLTRGFGTTQAARCRTAAATQAGPENGGDWRAAAPHPPFLYLLGSHSEGRTGGAPGIMQPNPLNSQSGGLRPGEGMVASVLISPFLGKPAPNRWSGLKGGGGPSKVAQHLHLADEDSRAPGIPQGMRNSMDSLSKGSRSLEMPRNLILPGQRFPNFCIFSSRSHPPNKPYAKPQAANTSGRGWGGGGLLSHVQPGPSPGLPPQHPRLLPQDPPWSSVCNPRLSGAL